MNYTVKAGDTLSRIAAANGTTVAALVSANRIADPNKIKVGQVLVIPAAGVTLNSSGAVIAPASGNAVADGIAQVIAAGANAHIAIKDAAENRKRILAAGVPVSDIPGEQVIGAETQQQGMSATVKYGLVAVAITVAGWLFLAEPPTSATNR